MRQRRSASVAVFRGVLHYRCANPLAPPQTSPADGSSMFAASNQSMFSLGVPFASVFGEVEEVGQFCSPVATNDIGLRSQCAAGSTCMYFTETPVIATSFDAIGWAGIIILQVQLITDC